MDIREVSTGSERVVHPLVLLFALLGGMTAWMAHITFEPMLVGLACRHDLVVVLHGLTAVTAVVTVAAIAVAVQIWRRASGRDTPHEAAFLGVIALLFNTISLVLIAFEEVPIFLVGPCT